MTNVDAENLKVGMGIKTFRGIRTIVDIKPHTGPHDFTLSILTFADGRKMTTEKGNVYPLAYEGAIIHQNGIKGAC